MSIHPLIRASLDHAWRKLQTEAKRISIELFDESAFRYLFVQALCQTTPAPACRTEWRRRVDLHLSLDCQCKAAIEFKFYVYRFHYDEDGNRSGRKGGAGLKNESEFKTCLAKLAKLPVHEVGEKYLILVYQDDQSMRGQRSFRRSYANIAKAKRNGCKIVASRKLPPFTLGGSLGAMHCTILRIA